MSPVSRPPLITRIQRLSMDDGPGLRDVVFLKGCRLACPWCHNPEAQRAEADILFFPERCIGCHACVDVCPHEAVVPREGYRRDRSRCQECGLCAETCPARAVEMVGLAYAPEALAELLARDGLYFENSGGGVTFSGGEPTLHLEYLAAVSVLLKARGISVALETSGDFDWHDFERHLLPHLDLVYFDIKLMDPRRHLRYAGGDNRRILSNFVRLSQVKSVALVPRTPLIPAITDSAENLGQIAEFLACLGISDWVKLPFNPAFSAKWEHLGRTAPELRP
jgi:pyruvate formate lyase activating enzyme